MKQPTNTRTSADKKRRARVGDRPLRGSGLSVSTITDTPARSTLRKARRPVARRRRPTNWPLILRFVALVVVLAVAGRFLLTSSRFVIRQVNIDGVQTLDARSLAGVADVPPHSNVFLFLLRQRRAYCRRIENSNPVIQSASVALEFPTSVRLHIVERQPSSVLHIQNGPSYLMDLKRIPFKTIAPNDSTLPIVTVPAPTAAIVKGTRLPLSTDSAVAAAYNLMTLVGSRQIGSLSDYREVIVDPDNNVDLLLRSGLLIKLGQADGLGDRLSMVETALTADPGLPAKAEYLDFTTTRPAIMRKQPPLATLSGDDIPTSTPAPLKSDIGQ